MSVQTTVKTRSTARPRTRLGPRSAGVLMTPDEFDALDQGDLVEHYRYELLNGVFVVSPTPGSTERGPNDVLGFLINQFHENLGAKSLIDATLPEQTISTAANRRRCDRAIWVGLGRTPDERVDVPAIVVEFVSNRKRDFIRDYEAKRAEYLAIGVREYWIFDRFRRVLTVFRPEGSDPIERIVAEDQTYRTELLPGFELPVGRILAAADRWGNKPRTRSKPPRRETTDG
jgi:Uma2 family endonuclease